jgi:hypothetical protein
MFINKIIMKKILTLLPLLFSGMLVLAQTGNIRFTIERNPSQENQVFIKAKNFSAGALSGVLGDSKLTLCITIPSSAVGVVTTISSPIVGQGFGEVLRSKFGTDSVFAWNGIGTTGVVNFAPNVDVHIATVIFEQGPTAPTALVKLACIQNGGTGFDYCYIAPGGSEQGGYSNPFYSNVMPNPLLVNCGGANDPTANCTSTVGINTVALPVKFLSFYALKTGDDAKLNWTVENDEDNQFFDIERSTDGRTYTKFASVNAKANGKSVNTYDGADARLSSLNAKTIYYRIKQLDKSGTSLYSPIRTLNVSATGSASLFPNPARSMSKLVVDAPVGGKASIVVRDATGKQAMQVNTNFVKGVNQLDLNVAALASGEYNVTITAEGVTQTLKLSKIN